MSFQYNLLMCSLWVFACTSEPNYVTDVSGGQGIDIDYPCLSADDECQNHIEVNGGTFQFYSSFHIDSSWDAKSAIVTVHGNNRNADDYFEKMVSVVADLGLTNELIVIAPKFILNHEKTDDSDWYWGSSSWKWGMQSYNSSTGNNASSYELLDSLLSLLGNKEKFSSLSDVLITGHSSGAAFVHHYLGSKNQNLYKDLNLYFGVVNTQYFFHPEPTRLLGDGSIGLVNSCDNYNSWPLGLSDLNPYMELIGSNTIRDNFSTNRVDYFISQYDTLTSSINSDCGHSILGNTRYEKIVNFISYMDMVFPSNNHEYTVIQGLGHTTNTFSSEAFKEYLMSIF